ncbi:MAG: PEP-CTERM sorting domain-containing protein [Planctomycetota bacterium]
MMRMVGVRVGLALGVGLLSTGGYPQAQAREIFWSETNSDAVFGASVTDGIPQRKIRDLDDTGRGERNYAITGITFADDFLYYTAAGQDRIYYSSTLGDTPRGQFINLDNAFGGMDYRPQGITANSEHVYWTDRATNSIYRADAGPALNRTGATVLIDLSSLNDDFEPREIVVFGEDLYWTDRGVDAIFRSDLDGNNVTQLIDINDTFDDGSYVPGNITATDRYIFWSDIETDIIYRADRDGGNAIELIDTNAPAGDGPLGLTTDGLLLYWTTFAGNEILAATFDGQVESTPRFTPEPDPTVSGFNVNALAIEYVPEPASLVLVAMGGLALTRRRRDGLAD